MELKVIEGPLSVCKVRDISSIDLTSDLFFIGKTDEELSLVCPTDAVPADTIAREDGWRALRIEGILDFALIGILSKITGVLADNNIGIFAVSTYNTDYILVKEADLEKAIAALTVAGYSIVM